MKHKEKQIENLQTEIVELHYEMNVIPLFHTRDGMFGLQTRDVLVGKRVVTKIFAAVDQDDGEKIVKEVTKSWLKAALDEATFDYYKNYSNETGWIVMTDDGPSVFETNEDDLEELYKNQKIIIYENEEKAVRCKKRL